MGNCFQFAYLRVKTFHCYFQINRGEKVLIKEILRDFFIHGDLIAANFHSRVFIWFSKHSRNEIPINRCTNTECKKRCFWFSSVLFWVQKWWIHNLCKEERERESGEWAVLRPLSIFSCRSYSLLVMLSFSCPVCLFESSCVSI